MKKIPVQQLTPRQLVLPLALCQFIASYACTNMNVAISDISKDLNTTVIGVQTAITLFTLTMAALMIPGSKLSLQLGFVVTIVGLAELLLFARATSSIWTFVPGLFLMGVGVGVMLTASVNVVQSAFPEKDQGEISGLSRSISNLGSSLGTAIAGSVLVSTLTTGNRLFALALATIAAFAAVGLLAAVLLPRQLVASPARSPASQPT